MYNGLTSRYKNEFANSISVTTEEITHIKYYNIPLSIGLSFIANNDKNHWVSFFSQLGMTLNYLKKSNHSLGQNNVISIEFDPSTSLGIRLGGGLLIKNMFTIDVNYYGLGLHKSNSNRFFNSVFFDSYLSENKISIVTIGLGLVIWVDFKPTNA